jgi:hypothetical protein
MAVPLRYPPSQKDMQQVRQQQVAYTGSLGPAAPIAIPNGANPHIIFQHIHELASKRISTLDYLRKAYVPWFFPEPLVSYSGYTLISSLF